MQEVLLVIQLFVAIALVAVILLQRSEGGALGIGGGPGGMMSARGAANLLTRATAILAAVFIGISLALAILARLESGRDSIITGTDDAIEQALDQPMVDLPTEDEFELPQDN